MTINEEAKLILLYPHFKMKYWDKVEGYINDTESFYEDELARYKTIKRNHNYSAEYIITRQFTNADWTDITLERFARVFEETVTTGISYLNGELSYDYAVNVVLANIVRGR